MAPKLRAHFSQGILSVKKVQAVVAPHMKHGQNFPAKACSSGRECPENGWK
jgi:hypothetical protein